MDEKNERPKYIDTAQVRGWIKEKPKWSCFRKEHTVWVDVRPEIGAIGQLLRELKVLEEYAPHEADILVVVGEEDQEAFAMLRNERFSVVSRKQLEKLAA